MPQPRVLLDRYELGELIGAGGSARVYVGRDRLLDRRVAVKVLDGDRAASADPAGHERFLREARSSARFTHRRAVATYDAGDDGGQLFIVMEYVEGTSLAHLIASAAPMAEDDVVRLGGQLLDALGAAHDVGLIHRDVKPANVLIDRDGDVKLADFGIAKRFDEISASLTTAGTVIGTQNYLAPEQAFGKPVGPKADLYAVGVVLYEMLISKRPPVAGDHQERGADPRLVRPDVSLELASTISTALALRPEHRFPSAADMSLALDGRLPPTELAPAPATPPTRKMPAAAATRVMAGAGSAAAVPPRARPTAVMPTDTRVDDRRKTGRGGGGWLWILALIGLLAIGIGVIALADRDRATVTSADATLPPAASGVATTAPPVESAAPETTAPPSTAATTPPTEPTTPPTEPTTPPTEPPVDELIPGFPATDDLDQFIDQLSDGKDVVGKQSKKLADGLEKVAEKDGEERADEIANVASDIEEWVDKGELDPTIGARALEFLAELADSSG